MPNEKFLNAVRDVDVRDLKVDRLGRVVIANPDVAKSVREIGALDPDLDSMASGDGICCGNDSCLSDQLVDMMNALTTGGRR